MSGNIITQAGSGKILSEDEIRAEECNAAVQAILQKYRCSMLPFCHIEPTGMQIGVKIIAARKLSEQEKQALEGIQGNTNG